MRRSFCVFALVLSFSIAVLCGCGGAGHSSPSSQTTTPTTPAQNPVPTITAISPASLVAGSDAQTITITGTGFMSSSAVTMDGKTLTTSYVSETSVTAAVPASAIASDGTSSITIANPTPGGGTSAAQSYKIAVPVGKITSLSPQVVPQGQAATVTITGTGFEAKSVVQWNGSARPTTFVNSRTLTVALTAADVQSFGSGSLAVLNPGLPPTTPLALAIAASSPTILNISPSTVQANSSTNVPVQVYIYGSGFASNATVQVNGQPVSVLSQNGTNITLSLSASLFASAGTISVIVSNPGTPEISSNTATIAVVGPTAPSFTVTPNSAPAGSPDVTITLWGSAVYKDSVVTFNGTKLSTKYAGGSQMTATIPASLLVTLVHGNVAVTSSENTIQPATQPFDTYVNLPVSDIVYNSMDGYIYASVAATAGTNLGNTVAAIDPLTGVVQKTIFVGSNPNRLALSTDGTQLFVGLDGAGAVRQVDLTSGTAGTQFSLGGGPGIYNPPYTAVSLAAVPGAKNSVAVYSNNGVVTIYDSGVARTNTSSGLSTYFNSNVGALAFGSSSSTLFVMSNAIGGYLYQLTVDSTGITASKQLPAASGGSTMQYDNGRIYIPTGNAISATTGAQVGQFSIMTSYSNTLAAASGPIVSDSSLNRVWILPNNSATTGMLVAFDATTFNPVGSLTVGGLPTSYYYSIDPGDLIRWGQNGLAFHASGHLYILQSALVQDLSGSQADVALSVSAPATATTGTTLTQTITVQNAGPKSATGIFVSANLPQTALSSSAAPSQGTCAGSGQFYCDLGTIASGSSATITVTSTPSTAGTIQLAASVSTVSYDPASTNNQSSASTTIAGSDYAGTPNVTQLSPNLVQAGSDSFVLTVDGSGFDSSSSILWNGQSLTTTFLSSGQLTATVDSTLIKNLGWAQVTVNNSGSGGGQSQPLAISIYQMLDVPANAISYDPFTQKLYAVLPSTSTSPTGNSIVAIDPATGTVGTAINVGSEPNLLSETSDGKYFYIGLSGAKSLGRFNLSTQSLDATIPLLSNQTYNPGQVAATAIATVPKSDTSLAVETNSYGNVGIVDISGTTATYRAKTASYYGGDNPVFVDATHFYAYDAATTGAEFYRYSIDGTGITYIDGTTLMGMGGFGGRLAVDGGFVYGSGGGIINPATTPPSQMGVLPLGSSSGSSITGGGVVPYAAESKSFNVGVTFGGYSTTVLDRFDTQHFTLDDQILLPTTSGGSLQGTRWGQDGLAYILPSSTSATSTGSATRIFLLQGPFVLPAEASSNSAPSLSTTDHNTITAGSGNIVVKLTGSGFLPGATVFWNGASRTTTYIDGTHVSVFIPATDVQSASTVNLTCKNPGSSASNTITITVQ